MTMPLTLDSPLRTDEHGTIRVGGTRVTLDTVIGAYRRGEAPEVIAEAFPTLVLADVYGAITYYLSHQAEVETYLAEGQAAAERAFRKLEELSPTAGLRERLHKVREDG